MGNGSLMKINSPKYAHYFRGKHLVVINKSSTPQDSTADLVINGKIGEVFSKLGERLGDV